MAEGYWPDPFAKSFSRGFGQSPGPLINRGQYARIAAICSIALILAMIGHDGKWLLESAERPSPDSVLKYLGKMRHLTVLYQLPPCFSGPLL